MNVSWFQTASDEIPNPNDWHAFNMGGSQSACGETRITYNVDDVADFVPDSGREHPACREAVDGVVRSDVPFEIETPFDELMQPVSEPDVEAAAVEPAAVEPAVEPAAVEPDVEAAAVEPDVEAAVSDVQ